MLFDHFLRDSSLATRQHLWRAYQAVEQFFLNSLGYQLRLECVAVGEPCFHANGERRWMTIPAAIEQFGTIFHEATHDLFHSSVFHGGHCAVNHWTDDTDRENPSFNEAWGEGFCEAVRWLMGNEIHQDCTWREDFRQHPKDSFGKQCGSLILQQSGYTLNGFAQLWLDLTKNYDHTAGYLKNRLDPG